MNQIDRRHFLQASAGISAASLLPWQLRADDMDAVPAGKADSCIFIWLGGGACQIDTWDPKRLGDPTQGNKVPGSNYESIPTAIEGASVCKFLPRCAEILDRGAIVRTCRHDVVDEHAAATNRLHVGRPPSGTTIYPSIGSVVAHQTGDPTAGVPAYMLMGYPNATRGPGFLGSRHGYVYLTDTKSGPTGLKLPEDVSIDRQRRRESLLEQVTDEYLERNQGNARVEDYVEATRAAFQLTQPEFMKVFDLETESDSLRRSYGGEFGQRCLLARRLVQEGVKFIEVAFNLNFINGTGWDTHNDGQKQQHVLIQQLDEALSALVLDLERHDRLDRTLVVVATEFGRPPGFDGGGGRGHQSKAFSMAMFGGGLKTGQVIGVTNELGADVVEEPVSIPDFHATIYHAMGIDVAKNLFDGDRPVPITDGGRPIGKLFG